MASSSSNTARDTVRNTSGNVSGMRSLENGYCYLGFFEKHNHVDMKEVCGAFPRLEEVVETAKELGLTPVRYKGFATRDYNGVIHLEFSLRSNITIGDVLELYGDKARIGGRYNIGKRAISIAPKPYRYLWRVLSLITAGLTFTAAWLGLEYLMLENVWNERYRWELYSNICKVAIGTTCACLLSVPLRYYYTELRAKSMARAALNLRAGAVPDDTAFSVRTTLEQQRANQSCLETNEIMVVSPALRRRRLTYPVTLDVKDVPLATKNTPFSFTEDAPGQYRDGANDYNTTIAVTRLPNPRHVMGSVLASIHAHDGAHQGFDVYKAVKNTTSVTPVLTREHIKQPVLVSTAIGGDALNWLKNNCANVELRNSASAVTNHALNAALRSVCLEIVHSSIPAGSRVLSVGSNPTSHPFDGYVHSIPIIDGRDANRRNKQLGVISALKNKGQVVEYHLDRVEQLIGCFDTMVCIHSVYDIPITQLFRHAVRLGCTRIVIVMACSPSMITEDMGVLPASMMRFQKFAGEHGTVITFTHLDESQNVYSHNWENVNLYIRTRKIIVGNREYSGDVLASVPENLILQFSLAPRSNTGLRDFTITDKDAATMRALNLVSGMDTQMGAQRAVVDCMVVPEGIFVSVVAATAGQVNPIAPRMESTVAMTADGALKGRYHPYLTDFTRDCEGNREVTETMMLCSKLATDKMTLNEMASTFELERERSYFQVLWNLMSEKTAKIRYADDMLRAITTRFPTEITIRALTIDITEDCAEIIRRYDLRLFALPDGKNVILRSGRKVSSKSAGVPKGEEIWQQPVRVGTGDASNNMPILTDSNNRVYNFLARTRNLIVFPTTREYEGVNTVRRDGRRNFLTQSAEPLLPITAGPIRGRAAPDSTGSSLIVGNTIASAGAVITLTGQTVAQGTTAAAEFTTRHTSTVLGGIKNAFVSEIARLNEYSTTLFQSSTRTAGTQASTQPRGATMATSRVEECVIDVPETSSVRSKAQARAAERLANRDASRARSEGRAEFWRRTRQNSETGAETGRETANAALSLLRGQTTLRDLMNQGMSKVSDSLRANAHMGSNALISSTTRVGEMLDGALNAVRRTFLGRPDTTSATPAGLTESLLAATSQSEGSSGKRRKANKAARVRRARTAASEKKLADEAAAESSMAAIATDLEVVVEDQPKTSVPEITLMEDVTTSVEKDSRLDPSASAEASALEQEFAALSENESMNDTTEEEEEQDVDADAANQSETEEMSTVRERVQQIQGTAPTGLRGGSEVCVTTAGQPMRLRGGAPPKFVASSDLKEEQLRSSFLYRSEAGPSRMATRRWADEDDLEDESEEELKTTRLLARLEQEEGNRMAKEEEEADRNDALAAKAASALSERIRELNQEAIEKALNDKVEGKKLADNTEGSQGSSRRTRRNANKQLSKARKRAAKAARKAALNEEAAKTIADAERQALRVAAGGDPDGSSSDGSSDGYSVGRGPHSMDSSDEDNYRQEDNFAPRGQCPLRYPVVRSAALPMLNRSTPESLLGQTTTRQTTDINHSHVGIATVTHILGRLAESRSASFLEAIFVNPQYVDACLPDDTDPIGGLIEALKGTIRIIIMHKNVYMTNVEDLDVNTTDVVILQTSDAGYARIFQDPEIKLGNRLAKHNFINLGDCTIDQLLIAGNIKLVSAPNKFCFFKAVLGDNWQVAVRDGENTCSAKAIIDLCNQLGVAVIDLKSLYLPQRFDFLRLNQIVFVINGHAYTADQTEVMRRLAHYQVLAISRWQHAADGENLNVRSECTTNRIMANVQKISNLTIRAAACTNTRYLSMLEAVNYSCSLENTLLSRYSLIGEDMSSSYLRAVNVCFIYDTKSKRFINKQPGRNFSVCWDGNDFIEVTHNMLTNKYEVPSAATYVLFSDDLEYLRERKMSELYYDMVMNMPEDGVDFLKVKLINGVPGCGKTHTILQKHERGVDLVCTATKVANNSYIEECEQSNKYRTYDSVLLNGADNSRRVYADEGMMVHAGELLLVCLKAGASEVEVYGDKLQIPWINRAVGFDAKHWALDYDEIEYMNVTRRLPTSMMPVMRNFYPEIETTSKNEGVIEVLNIRSPPTVTKEFDIVLVFTQAEKYAMMEHTSVPVNTIHEVQGETYDNVAIVRLVIQDNSIYESEPHIIVGLSRHRNKLVYITMSENDSITKVLRGNKVETISASRETTTQLQPFKIPVCHYPNFEMMVGTLGKAKTAKALPFSQHIINKMFYTTDTEPVLRYRSYYTRPPVDTKNGINVATNEVQMLIDIMFERRDDQSFEQMMGTNPFPLEAEFNVDYGKLFTIKPKSADYLRPILMTPQPLRCAGTLIETIVAIRKRNLSPPMINLTVAPQMIDNIVDVFMSTFVDNDALIRASMSHDYSSVRWFEDWLSLRTGEELQSLNAFELRDFEQDKYASHVKPDHKPKLDNSHNEELIAGQVLTAHHPMVTAEFAGVMRCFTSLLKRSLRSKWLINDGVTMDELSGHANKVLCGIDEIISHEIDFSKFDKSQEEVVLLATCKILQRFGMPERFVTMWFNCHTTNLLIFHNLGIRVTTKFQRRSGDVLTFTGNTITSMTALAYTNNYEEAIGGIFGGDDAVVYLPANASVIDQSKQMGNVFNLTIKMENYINAMYFASKFQIYVLGMWLFVPDPIKAIVRLGRHDLYCGEHVELYYQSFKDNFKAYRSEEVRIAVAKVANIRYAKKVIHMPTTLLTICDFINDIAQNKQKFLRLYDGTKTKWDRKMPITMKKGEMERRQNHLEKEDMLDMYN